MGGYKMGIKRFVYMLTGAVFLSVILLHISDAARARGLEIVVYFTAFFMCIAVLKPAPGEHHLRWEGGSVENTFAMIFLIAAPFIGSIAWYLTAIIYFWIAE